MTERNECVKCGACCIVCTDAQLTNEEVISGKYKYQTRNNNGKLDRFSNKILKRKKAFVEELGKEIFMCCYFDPMANLCTIYKDRPQVCRQFNCKEEILSSRVNKIWKEILDGKDNAYCEIG